MRTYELASDVVQVGAVVREQHRAALTGDFRDGLEAPIEDLIVENVRPEREGTMAELRIALCGDC